MNKYQIEFESSVYEEIEIDERLLNFVVEANDIEAAFKKAYEKLKKYSNSEDIQEFYIKNYYEDDYLQFDFPDYETNTEVNYTIRLIE